MPTVSVTDSITSNFTSYDETDYSYASITSGNPLSNGFANSSSTTYAQVALKTGSNAQTYVYMRFDLSSIPEGATINSVSAQAKGYISTTTASRVSTRQMQLCSGTTLKGSALTLSTSTNAQTFSSVGSWTRAELLDAGVRFYAVRGTSNTTTNYYIRIYGGNITVNYTYQEITYTITVSNSTNATVATSASEVAAGEDVEISASTISGITIKDNGTDITNQFTQAQGDTISTPPSSNFTTGFSQSGTNFYQSSSTTSTSWLEYALGHTAESPYSTSNTSNTYAKPEGTTAWINYHFDFSDIPLSATITSVSVKVYGARENATVDNTHVARFQCYSGDTAKGTQQDFTSTQNGIVTVTDVGTWTSAELHDAQLRFEVGYYGGRMLGITWTVAYELSGYVYTITNISTDHTILVTNAGGSTPTMYVKVGGAWVAATAVYKKINGSWVQQSDLSNVFTSGVNYLKR